MFCQLLSNLGRVWCPPLSARPRSGCDVAAPCGRSGGFDKGRRPVRLPADRAGFWPARMSPMRAAARVPLSNPPRPWRLPGLPRPRTRAFRASRPALARPERSASESDGQGAVSAARAARGAALKPYRKFSHRGSEQGPRQSALSRLMLYTHGLRLMLDTPARASGVERGRAEIPGRAGGRSRCSSDGSRRAIWSQVATQKIHVGMIHARKTVTVTAEDNQFTLVIDGETAGVVPRTTTREMRRYKLYTAGRRSKLTGQTADSRQQKQRGRTHAGHRIAAGRRRRPGRAVRSDARPRSGTDGRIHR